MKTIDFVETWKLKSPFSSLQIAQKVNGKRVDWVMMKHKYVGPEWYQVFCNIEGMKFNWIIRLWSKINGLE